MELKVCTKCGQEKLESEEFFSKEGRGHNGFRATCRECRNLYKKQYHKDNAEHEKELRKQYYVDNAEREKESVRQWRIDNPDKVKEYNKEYGKTHIELKSKIYKVWANANIKHLQQYRKINFVHHKAISQIWLANNKDKSNMKSQRRRSLKKQVASTLTTVEWNNIKKYFNNKCAYCNKEEDLTREHFIALSKGGEFSINNIIPVCNSCNCSKRDKDFFEWYPKQESYSKVREQIILKYLNYNNKIQQLAFII